MEHQNKTNNTVSQIIESMLELQEKERQAIEELKSAVQRLKELQAPIQQYMEYRVQVLEAVKKRGLMANTSELERQAPKIELDQHKTLDELAQAASSFLVEKGRALALLSNKTKRIVHSLTLVSRELERRREVLALWEAQAALVPADAEVRLSEPDELEKTAEFGENGLDLEKNVQDIVTTAPKPELFTQDRRQQPRIPCSLDVTLQKPNMLLFEGTSQNVSPNGIFVATVQEIETGSLIHLTIQLGEGKGTVQADGVVVWRRSRAINSSPPGIGINFTAISAEDKAKLTTLLRQELSNKQK